MRFIYSCTASAVPRKSWRIFRRLLTRAALLRSAAALLVLAAVGQADPIKVWPSNPHYFSYKGKPLVLVTSDHHYGAVIDRDFDYARYLDYPAGNYRLEWIDPASGAVKGRENIRWQGGDLAVTTPVFSMDLALSMRARNK